MQTVRLYKNSYLLYNLHVELIPRAYGNENGHRDMQIVIFRRCVIVCPQSKTRTDCQYYRVHYYFVMCSSLAMLEILRIFFPPVISCSLVFRFKCSVFESDCRLIILFIKYIFQKSLCMCEVYHLLI